MVHALPLQHADRLSAGFCHHCRCGVDALPCANLRGGANLSLHFLQTNLRPLFGHSAVHSLMVQQSPQQSLWHSVSRLFLSFFLLFRFHIERNDAYHTRHRVISLVHRSPLVCLRGRFQQSRRCRILCSSAINSGRPSSPPPNFESSARRVSLNSFPLF